MVVSSSYMVLLTVLGLGAAVPAIDTATGSVTAISDTDHKFNKRAIPSGTPFTVLPHR